MQGGHFFALSDDQLTRLLAGEQAVQELKAFYQRAAANRDAVLFRVA
jgi:hypothetical protein